MSTFLEICQAVARESGVHAATISSAEGQSGETLNIVNWVIEAWNQIQNIRPNWKWNRQEFSGSLTASTSQYTAASFAITDFSHWVEDDPADNYYPMSIYLTATGTSDEGEIAQIKWTKWRDKYGRGSQTNNRPTEWAISPQLELCYGPIPDDAFTVNGEYYPGNQVLALNGDIPRCPVRFHPVIQWKALTLLGGFDEAPFAIGHAQSQFGRYLSAMEIAELPDIELGGGPLA